MSAEWVRSERGVSAEWARSERGVSAGLSNVGAVTQGRKDETISGDIPHGLAGVSVAACLSQQ